MDKFVKRNKTQNKTILDSENETFNEEEQELIDDFDTNLSREIIMKEKNDILQKLQMKNTELRKMHKKLKNYRYISQINEFKIGNYIRWINIKKAVETEEVKLTNGGFICDIIENSSGDPNLLCRNTFNNIFEVVLTECVVFQKLNNHEKVIMSILQYINNAE